MKGTPGNEWIMSNDRPCKLIYRRQRGPNTLVELDYRNGKAEVSRVTGSPCGIYTYRLGQCIPKGNDSWEADRIQRRLYGHGDGVAESIWTQPDHVSDGNGRIHLIEGKSCSSIG
jgi:hypothetical protein